MRYKYLLSAILFLMSFSFIRAISMIDDFKNKLFYCQCSLVNDKEQYFRFIDPYIEEAKNSLSIVKYMLLEKREWDFYDEYLKNSCYYEYQRALIAYNVNFFNTYVSVRKGTKRDLDFYSEALLKAIERIKEEANLVDLDVREEFNKTVELFQRANIAYYKKMIPFHKKILSRVFL